MDATTENRAKVIEEEGELEALHKAIEMFGQDPVFVCVCCRAGCISMFSTDVGEVSRGKKFYYVQNNVLRCKD